MHIRIVLLMLARLLRPDKSLQRDIATDFRNLGILTVGAGMAGYLLQAEGPALLLLTLGYIIWGAGLYISARVNALDVAEAKAEDDAPNEPK